jgi:2-oxoglutarate ferredoxin oxidoreductase subunit alpha
MKTDFSLLVGGEAGQGVQSVGAILARTLAAGGYHVYADQDYESRIRGGHNFFRVRVASQPVVAISEKQDTIIALNAETVTLHKGELKDSGVIIYDRAATRVEPEGESYLDVPMTRLAEERAGSKLMSNTVAAGATIGVLGYDFNLLETVLKKEFARHGDKIVADNVNAARAGYDVGLAYEGSVRRGKIRPIPGAPKRLLVTGNEALAFGALVAGCRFMAGYPMTPATPILEYLAARMRSYPIVVVHAEDELSAINMAVGAGYAGVRAMVATSGGGFALMVEGLALAGMTETPVVVVLGQRPGPATGLPTRTEQGELWFAIHAGHGEFPRAVLAPGTAEEAFNLAVKAFNLAEKYQTPVIILTDDHLASSYRTVAGFDLAGVKIERGALLSDVEVANFTDYKRHRVTDSGISPRALPLQGRALVVTDSDEHDETGHLIEDAANRRAQNSKRLRKMNGLAAEISPPQLHRVPKAEMTLIGWGSTCGAIWEAASILKRQGLAVNTLHLTEVWPFPAEAVSRALAMTPKSIVAENNATGQMARLIRRETGYKVSGSLLRFDGRPFTPQTIVAELGKEVA